MSDLVNPSKKIVRNEDVGLIDDMVWESLVRLPVKNLMRCKCLSKYWKDKIESAAFSKQYKGGFRGLLVVENNLHRLDEVKHFFYLPLDPLLVELDDVYPSTLLRHHMNIRATEFGWETMGYTSVVNGFVCFYSGRHCYLFNVATREKIPLPASEDEKDTFHFGFDPFSNVYKVLKLRVAYQGGYNKEDSLEKGVFVENLASQILTIDMESEEHIVIEPQWRTIEGPPSLVGTNSLIIGDSQSEYMERCLGDGHMYWFLFGVIVDFNLVEEKFEIITPPVGNWVERYDMPMFGGKLMILRQNHTEDMRLFSVHPYVREIVGARWGECWTFPKAEWDESIDVEDMEINSPRPIGVLPNGKLVVYNEDSDKNYPAPLSLFDPEEGVHSQMVVNVDETFPDLVLLASMAEIFYIEENIRSLKLGGQ